MPDWSLPSTLEATSVHHGYATAKATESEALDHSGGRWPVTAWYAKLEPGGFILPHTDQGPWRERWHYPIQPAGYVWQEDSGIAKSPTVEFHVKHWLPHAVWNPDDIARIHLIVEYDKAIDEPYRDLEVFDPLPEMADLVRNARQTTRV